MCRQIAIVTGASSGIGRVSARALARSGFAVVLVGRRAVALEDATASIRDGAGSAEAIVADVTNPGSVERLFAGVLDRYGRVDLLFNNAGSNISAAEIDAIDLDQWRAVQDAIVTGTFLCTREAFRIMKAQKPRGAGSSTTVRFRPTRRGPARPPTPPPSTRSRA